MLFEMQALTAESSLFSESIQIFNEVSDLFSLSPAGAEICPEKKIIIIPENEHIMQRIFTETFEYISSTETPYKNLSSICSNRICIGAYGLSPNNLEFIRNTHRLLKTRLGVDVVLVNDKLKHSTHIIVETDRENICAPSSAYLLGILLQKPVVSFSWYISLIDSYSVLSLKTITLLNLARMSYEAPHSHAHMLSTPHTLYVELLSEFNVLGPISESAKKLVYLLGGTVNESITKRETLSVSDDQDLYALLVNNLGLYLKSTVFSPKNQLKPN